MLANILGDSIKSKVLDKGRKVEAVESKTTPTMAVLNITAKNFITLPAIARDLNVARQAMITLVKLAGGKATNKADSQMLKEGDRVKRLDNKQGKSPTPEDGEGGGLGGRVGKKIWKNLKRKLGRTKIGKAFRRLKIGIKRGIRKLKKFTLRILKKIFNPKLLLKIFTPKNIGKILFKLLRVAGPVGLVVTLVGSVVNGAIDAWNTWKETGSIWETLKAYLGGMWEFLTFGLITKETIDSLTDSIIDLLNPIKEAFIDFKDKALEFISEKWISFTDWFSGTQTLVPKKQQPKLPKSKISSKSANTNKQG
jgi:hypothetical protein